MSKYVGKIVTDQAPAGYSVFFDGSGDYLTVANNAALQLGSSGFTIEGWFYFTQTPNSYNALCQKGIAGDSNLEYVVYLRPSSNTIEFGYTTNGSTYIFISSSSVTINQNAWYHVAVTRSGNTLYFFLNGVAAGSSSFTSTIYTGTASLGIAASNTGTNIFAAGYISNLRIVKGTALYTAAFTPPTQLLNVTNTSLLTCNSPAIIDQSNNAFAITVNGNSAVSTFTPFTAYVPYNPALGASTPGVWTLDEAMQAAATRQWNMYDPNFQNTTLLLHGNGTNGAQNNTFLDSSSNNFTITRNGNTTQGSFSPFSQTGWGNYLNGSTDYFRVSDNAAFDFGTGAFCIEMWFMLTADAAQNGETNREATLLAAFPDSGTLATTYAIGIGGNSTTTGTAIAFSIRQSDTIAYNQTYTATITKNVWHHIAVCRSGNDFAMFYDGLRVSSNASYTYTVNTNHSVKIGALIYPTYNHYFPGYISNLRIVKGASVYAPTSLNIAVPTEPLGTTSGGQTPPTGTQTSLLTCQSNRFVDNSSNAFAITVNGTPSVQAFSPFYPTAAYTPQTIGGNGYFDGTGDSLEIADNTAFTLDGDFTIEGWLYPFSVADSDNFIGKWQPSNQEYLFWPESGVPKFYWAPNSAVTALLTSSVSIPTNAWTHLAVTRSGNSFTMWVNGVSRATATNSSAVTNTSSPVEIGRLSQYPPNYDYQGYMAGVRIVKGTAVYTTGFTPPTAPVTAITNTSLLLNFTNAGIVDSTAKNVLETVGNAQISTTQSKFGGSSMYFDGTGDYLSTIATPNLALGSGDFTIEAWVYANSLGSFNGVVAQWPANGGSTSNSFVLESVGSNMEFYWSSGSTLYGPATLGTISTGTWAHYAICRSGNTLYPFKNGVLGSTVSITQTLNSPTSAVTVGGLVAGSGFWNGYIDDLRITKGVARYTANFTPQTSQWQDQ